MVTMTWRSWSSCLFVLSCLLGVEGSRRRLQAANEAYDYYDRLRTDPSLVQEVQGSNESMVFRVVDSQGDEYRLADISGFLPFTDGTNLRSTVENEVIAALMAIYHLNNPAKSPIIDARELEGCNVRLTTEFLDTQFSPINSTRSFTNILLRNHSLDDPLPSSVVGAYRSATTSPLAILTGVNGIPQVSYASTSTDFEVKEQYPLFGRTIPSTIGEAEVAVKYFQTLGATHVGILFVTDAYGSALQKSFQDAAAEANITTASVAFSYSAVANGEEIPNAVESLSSTQFRYIYAICFNSHYEPIMTAAFDSGLTGKDFLWVFPGLDRGSFQNTAVYPPGSPLASVTQGIAILTASGGLLAETLYPGEQVEVAPLEENPTTGFQKFRTAWRAALADPEFDAYIRTKFPESLKAFPSFDPNADFGLEPTQLTPIMYDAVAGLGLAMCRAGARVDFFNGTDIFKYFSNLTFEGASGNVVLDPETGTRNYTTVTYILWNVQNYAELDEQGRVQFQLAPTYYHENGQWNQVENMTFIYGDNSTETPDSLPPADMNYNYIGEAGLVVGYILMGIVMLFAIAAFVWLFWFHGNKVVSSAQPLFLLMVCVGSFIMASTILPLSLQEPVSQAGLDIACMASPWIYVVGSIITFSPLFAKTRGIYVAYKNPQLDFIHVTSCDIFTTLAVILGLNLAVLIPWTIVAPLEWVRTPRESQDVFERPVESYGSCSNENALPFVIVILIVNVGLLVLANWWAYRSRNIETEYQESRYIGISMASVLQAWCMGVPILIVVWDNPSAKFFVQAGIVFVTSLAVLLLIFTPKVLAIRSERVQRAQEEKRGAYNRFQARARMNSSRNFEDEEEEDSGEMDNKAVGVNGAAEVVSNGDCAENHCKSSTSTADATASSEFAKPPPQDVAEAEAAGAVAATGVVVGTAGVATAGALARASSSESTSNSFRSNLKKTISEKLLQGGAMKADETAEQLGGIKILHNPMSERNLQASGGLDISRDQLLGLEAEAEVDEDEQGEEDEDASEDEGGMGVVEEDPGEEEADEEAGESSKDTPPEQEENGDAHVKEDAVILSEESQ